ncbi:MULTISPECIES: hypothetical protein [Caloramator]|uniref:Uncharacterized protein n=1 Tax=Caloramator proteoclasticus DSM 10124 TaxID=1121262 RepID=A0A1M4WGK9_9CLOT|nr:MULTISPECIES: hypothetical protein [Caloramator]SHE80325.1 hypothetical protein SAMN02746091_01145 [Caloramator proteoclasticus DSM 10124]
MNKGAYKYLFWGMMYIFLNIHIGYLNILPNFVGYIFILYSLNLLSGEIEILNKAKLPTIVLIPIGIKDILEQNYLYKLLETQYSIIILKFLNSLEVVLFLYVLYILCQGISSVLRDRGLLKIEKSINNAFRTFFIFSVLVIFFDPFSLNLPLEFGYIAIISAIVCCIIGLYLGYLFKKIGDAI